MADKIKQHKMKTSTLVGHGEHRNLPVGKEFTPEQKLKRVALCQVKQKKVQTNKNSFLLQRAPRQIQYPLWQRKFTVLQALMTQQQILLC